MSPKVNNSDMDSPSSEERLTDESYWKMFWENQPGFRLVNPLHHHDKDLLDMFSQADALLKREAKPPFNVLEIGCGGSVWLGFLANHFEWNMAGLDFESTSLEITETLLEHQNASASLYRQDMFSPDESLLDRFDLVYSRGVIEHFENTLATVQSIVQFVRPGGLILTEIPNYHSNLLRCIQQRVGPKILAKHKLISLSDLRTTHEELGVETYSDQYIGLGLAIIPDGPESTKNVPTPGAVSPPDFLKKMVLRFLRMSRKYIPFRNRFISATCVYLGKRKPS